MSWGIYVLCIAMLWSICHASQRVSTALLSDLLPPIGDKCLENGITNGKANSSFTFDFSWSNFTDHWDASTAPYEKDIFLAEMEHFDENRNRTWKIRVAKGGFTYSYIGDFGEIMPPQLHDNAPWIDEVWQMVAVNTDLNTNDDPWFIHQAGTYTREPELVAKPMYAPSLASNCEGNVCMFAGWGQQAHVPTIHTSTMMYLNRYVDCGDGILETTYMMFNMNVSGSVEISYTNVPWGGVRTSVLPDVHIANGPGPGTDYTNFVGNSGSTQHEPILQWGIAPMFLPNLKATGGYTSFSEDLPLTTPGWVQPCGLSDGTGTGASCDTAGTEKVVLKMSSDSPCVEDTGRTAGWGVYTVKCNLQTTVINRDMDWRSQILTFSSPRNESFTVNGILFLSDSGTRIHFWPATYKAADINAIFNTGETLRISYFDTGKPLRDQRALTFIHGIDNEADDSYWNSGDHKIARAPSRIRLGKGGSITRDYTVYTVNCFVNLIGGQRFWKREYILVDHFTGTDSNARTWVPEVKQGLILDNDVPDSIHYIDLYSQNNYTFGSELKNSITKNLSSYHEYGHIRCSGRSAPHTGLKALFAITCGNQHYLGQDMYYFMPKNNTANGSIIRSYRCDSSGTQRETGMNGQTTEGTSAEHQNEWTETRATWTLMGFFTPGDCDYLREARYDSEFEEKSLPLPSAGPTPSPTVTPTPIPTPVPTQNPTQSPTLEPSVEPTPQPSLEPTPLPTIEPTQQPTYEVVLAIKIPVKQTLTTTTTPEEFLENDAAIYGFRNGVITGLNSLGNNPISNTPYTHANIVVNNVVQTSSRRRKRRLRLEGQAEGQDQGQGQGGGGGGEEGGEGGGGGERILAAALEVDYSIIIEVKNSPSDTSTYMNSVGFASVFADVTSKVSDNVISSAITTSVSNSGGGGIITVTAANAIPPNTVSELQTELRSASPSPTFLPTNIIFSKKGDDHEFVGAIAIAIGVVGIFSIMFVYTHYIKDDKTRTKVLPSN